MVDGLSEWWKESVQEGNERDVKQVSCEVIKTQL